MAKKIVLRGSLDITELPQLQQDNTFNGIDQRVDCVLGMDTWAVTFCRFSVLTAVDGIRFFYPHVIFSSNWKNCTYRLN